ncbi:MAG: hypothetical protein KF841_11435 [Phycisphaerae bacterium]|nr:hypothetical protein [Phycisphaerae bacterium]
MFFVLPLAVCICTPLLFQIGSGLHENAERQLQIRFADADKRRIDALYDLLKPNDVNVLVGRTPGGVELNGTAGEIRSLSRLIEMIQSNPSPTRTADQTDARIIRRTYRLRDSRAADLARVLSFTPSHVRYTLDQGTLIVTATPEDHYAIDSVVRLLGGRSGN